MVGRKRSTPSTPRNTRRSAAAAATTVAAGRSSTIPNIVAEMLDEAGVDSQQQSPERPLKRRRAGRRSTAQESHPTHVPTLPGTVARLGEDEDESEDGLEFEDVMIPEPNTQTMNRGSDDESDEESDEEGIIFEDVDLSAAVAESPSMEKEPKSLELNLTAQNELSSPSRRRGAKRKPISKEERARRVEVHKTHLLCLLAHVSMRNKWCNDGIVQGHLESLLTQRDKAHLNPRSSLSQFGRSESLKTGLRELGTTFKTKYQITERGLRRALWAEEPEHLSKYELPADMESCLDRPDFREAAKTLRGSRDVGAQLYCALLRAAGVRARLVCSLQPLSFTAAGPVLPKPREPRTPAKQPSKLRRPEPSPSREEASSSRATPFRRPIHPSIAAHYRRSTGDAPRNSPAPTTPKRIRESPFPVYWVEVLDVAHQKWHPADPLVTRTFWKRALEPPLTDKENAMTYVVAFDADGTARDVTRRYAKAYTAKTRRLRIDAVMDGGDRWWRRALRNYSRGYKTDLEQIEDNELAALETREPMPRNIADFKGHPLYALERHLRRNEVLIPGARDVGTAAAGPRAPLERIYLRKDVKIARSKDKWYRMGRIVKDNEIPAKFLAPQRRTKGGRTHEDGDDPETAGLAPDTPLYTVDQTEIFRHPPVANGIVPKNKFRNIDVYVPTMVPEGGVHIAHELAARAAFLSGVDYAPALTGFDFKGQHGTAVLRGVVVAKEYEEAVWTVIQGLVDLETEMEQERRTRATLRKWRKFLMALRIRQDIWKDVDDEKEADQSAEAAEDEEMVAAIADVMDEDIDDDDEDEGGFVDDELYGEGGFVID